MELSSSLACDPQMLIAPLLPSGFVDFSHINSSCPFLLYQPATPQALIIASL